MNRILLLGGTAEALAIAAQFGTQHIYSLAGVGGRPAHLHCQVHVGGFGGTLDGTLDGTTGLTHFLAEQHITLLVDATHPYAAQISRHAIEAARQSGIPCWALHRGAWQPQLKDDWQEIDNDWQIIHELLTPFQRPLFTLGRRPLAFISKVPEHQHWFIRCLHPHPGTANVTVLPLQGPFTLDSERSLFAQLGVDVLITKNSGSAATEPKLTVARERNLPVIMLKRPELPHPDRTFNEPAALLNALLNENYL